MNKREQPTILAVFGVTGDLVARKLLPALYHLYATGQLPKKFRVVGIARRPFSDVEFRKLMKKSLLAKVRKPERVEKFLKMFTYHQGQFDTLETFTTLKKVLGTSPYNKLFYLATPPNFYDGLLHKLHDTGLSKQTGKLWTRIIVEKPFGKDLDHAEHLDVLLGKLFDDSQVYRIDHYLAKPVLQDILAFRFDNNLLEDVWNHKFIEKIEVRLLEHIDVEGRGEFYDGVGALLDVGQNHLLQELALVTMDKPKSFFSQDIQAGRAQIIQNLKVLNAEEIKHNSVRAQYAGYKKERGVAKNSNTETYFKIRTYINNPRWKNIPIILEAGKNFPENDKSIVVTFKGEHPNRVIFRIQPNPGIEIEFYTKKGEQLEKKTLHFNYEADPTTRYLAEYAKLICDSINGDQTLFVGSSEAIASWRFIDPIVKAWFAKTTPLLAYKKDVKILSEFDKLPKPKFAFNKIAMVGLGKMGKNLATQIMEKDFEVVATNAHSKDAVIELSKNKLFKAYKTDVEMIKALPKPRLVWLMVPNAQVEEVLFGKNGLDKILERGDIVVDSGNTYFKDTIRRGQQLAKKGIEFMDVGFSGGPSGARHGGCLMIGGKKTLYEKLEPLFAAMAADDSYKYFGSVGAGHFVKMVHNGIEYGMMQSLAEGFGILKASQFKLNLIDVADIYNHGSVIESRLVGWIKKGLEQRGQNLKGISGVIGYTGEGEWTAKTAKQLRVPAKIIEESFLFRVKSKRTQNFVTKMVSSMREQFGGHSVK